MYCVLTSQSRAAGRDKSIIGIITSCGLCFPVREIPFIIAGRAFPNSRNCDSSATGNNTGTVTSAKTYIIKQSKLSKLMHHKTTREAGSCDRVNGQWLLIYSTFINEKIKPSYYLSNISKSNQTLKSYRGQGYHMSCFPLTRPLLQCKRSCLGKFFKFVEMSKCLDVCYLLYAIASAYFSGTGGGGTLQVF